MSTKLRLFVAVHFSPEVIQALARLSDKLQKELDNRAPIKWVSPKNMHLTLQFLGDMEEGLLPKLAGSLSGAYVNMQPFEVDLAGVGAFPQANRAKVIWAGMRHGADGLKALHAATLGITSGFGVESEDRSFKAHATLGRVKAQRRRAGYRGGRAPDISGVLEPLKDLTIEKCQISEVHLVRSELTPTGPIYTTLDSFPIGG